MKDLKSIDKKFKIRPAPDSVNPHEIEDDKNIKKPEVIRKSVYLDDKVREMLKDKTIPPEEHPKIIVMAPRTDLKKKEIRS